MSNSIIPEVVKTQLQKDSNQPTLNLKLEQNIDKRISYNQTYTTNNTTNNSIQKGFFRFVLEILFLPVIIIHKVTKHIFTKYDLKNKYKAEKIKVAKSKWVNKYLKSTNDVYNFEEVF